MLSWWFLYGYALVGYWSFTAYWALYWRLSFAVRRGQEYDADRGAVAAGVLGLYLGHAHQQFQARMYAAEHPPLSVPSVPIFTGVAGLPDLQQRLARDLPSLSPTFLLPRGLPSVPVFTTVTVRQGDTLSLIACQHSTTVAALQSLNHLSSSTTIKVGQRLTVPTLQTTTAACG